MRVMITGGELFNKGAQSMTFSVVHEVKQRYPDAEVILLSSRDFVRSENEKAQYKFEILPWDLRVKIRKLPVIGRFFALKYFTPQQEADMWNKVEHCDLVIDVSGYCLSSQFSLRKILDYLLNIQTFKRFGRKLYLLPQSFGPFEFGGIKNALVNPIIAHYLAYPQKVFCRESDGEKWIRKIGVKRPLILSPDTVLQSQIPAPDSIYHQPKQQQIHLRPGAVAIIPNQKVFVHNANNALMNLYVMLIDALKAKGKHVYLLRHSHEDLKICQEIKSHYENDESVEVLGEDYDAYQLTHIIGQAEMVVSSRYHGVVHAYKCQVPCLVLGWAVKYQELVTRLGQEDYCFDVRNDIDANGIVSSANQLLDNNQALRSVIGKRMIEVKKSNLFNQVFGEES